MEFIVLSNEMRDVNARKERINARRDRRALRGHGEETQADLENSIARPARLCTCEKGLPPAVYTGTR